MNHYHTHNIDIEIKEQRATTDESIRLYKEFNEKANNNLIAQVTVKVNNIEGKVFIIEDYSSVLSIKLLTKFNINGIEYSTNESFDKYSILTELAEESKRIDRTSYTLKTEAVVNVLLKHISNKLAEELLKQNIEIVTSMYNI